MTGFIITASTADFFQFSGCRGELKVINCKAYGAHDDYINVHGTHLRIIKSDENENSITVRFMHNESWGFQAFEIGDELEFIKWDTLKPYYSVKVKDFTKVNDTDIKLYLDKDIPRVKEGKDVVENISWTPDLYVQNCSFSQTAGRGILATTRGKVVIENSVFSNCTALENVVIPDSVTSIGSMAFVGNKLTELVIPDIYTDGTTMAKVKALANAASSTGVLRGNTTVTNVVIGRFVNSIGNYAFEGCKKLKTITIKSKKLKKVGSKAIKGIYKKATIKCPGKTYVKKYKKLFKSKTGYKKTMKIK